MPQQPKFATSVGRPRRFDLDQALESALRLFWRYGYEGVSIVDLTSVMHIAAPSLYAAFGSKEQLYREALHRYQNRPGLETLVKFQQAGPIADRIKGLLRATVRAVTNPDYPAGCMITAGMLCSGPACGDLAETVKQLRVQRTHALEERLKKAISNAEMPPNTDPKGLAKYLAAVMQGIVIQAHDGASARDLYALVEIVIRAVLVFKSGSGSTLKQSSTRLAGVSRKM